MSKFAQVKKRSLKDVSRDLVNYIRYRVECEIVLKGKSVFEYDIQHFVDDFLRFKFSNTPIKIKREKNNRTDISLFDYDKKQFTSSIEIKTFIKPNENFTFEKIKKDLDKLKNQTSPDNYLLVVFINKNLKNDKKNEEFAQFVNSKYKNFPRKEPIIKGKVESRMEQFSEKGGSTKKHLNQLRAVLFKISNYPAPKVSTNLENQEKLLP